MDKTLMATQHTFIMSTEKIESELTKLGIPIEQLCEWSDAQAKRIGELLIEWSKR